MRALGIDGAGEDVGVLDPRRSDFERMCRMFGAGEVNLGDFRHLFKPGSGLALNSLQSPYLAETDEFNRLARLFIEHANYDEGHFPQEIELVMFMGLYDQGFGMHRDSHDVVAFVLDGTKQLAVRDNTQVDRVHTLNKGQYLRWESAHWHGNVNPNHQWAVTINFSVGNENEDGEAPSYVYPRTKLKNLVDFMRRRKRIEK